MHYSDLVQRTTDLPLGRHPIYKFSDGTIEIRNLGVRHHDLSPQPEFRLYLLTAGREFAPRHGDFFTDFQLKVDIRPDLRLALTETCEQICNGMDPLTLIPAKGLPAHFADAGESTWTMQTSMYQTAGFTTEIFLCGLQTLIRVYELNDYLEKPQEAFRGIFLGLEKAIPLAELLRSLQPMVRPSKRYFDRLQR